MMLRSEANRNAWIGWALMAAVGAGAAALVLLGNPGNMGLCGACFLRDTSGSLGMFGGAGPKIFRPEVVGVIVGAFLWMLACRKFAGRAGSHAAARFAFGVLMAFAALVFLGCPFRMLQRVGGGDLNAIFALPGFVGGVGLGLLFERNGYTVGKTSIVTPAVGLLAPVIAVAALALFIAGLLPVMLAADQLPAHAPWMIALGIALVAGAIMSATGFCAISAARQVFLKDRRMLIAAATTIAGYAAVMLIAGKFRLSIEGQPIAHTEILWNALALALVGLTGVMVGGCPVRQLVMSGEGNGDAFVTVIGLLVGGALAHNLSIASSPAGTTPAGRWTVVLGLAVSIAYALWVMWTRKNEELKKEAAALDTQESSL